MFTGNSINETEKKLKYTNLSEGRFYIGTKDVGFDHEINYDNGVRIPFDADKFRIAPPNSILLCIEGGSAGRKIAFTNQTVCFGNKLCCFISYEVDSRYIYYYLQSPIFQSAFKNNITGIIGGVSVNTLKDMLLPIPPISEQYRIVKEVDKFKAFIIEYDKKDIELGELNKSFPDQLKKSILQEAVQGKLVPQDPNDEPASVLLERIRAEKERLIAEGKIKRDKHESRIFKRDNSHYEKIGLVERCIDDEIPFEIPDSWEWVRLSLICNVINGFTPLRANPIFWDNGTIPWFTVEDIHSQGRQISYTKQHITESALNKDSSRILPPETVLLCCTASVGEYAISKIPLTTNQQFNGLVIYDYWKEAFSSEFLFILVQTFKKRLIDIAGKTTINYVSVKKLNELLVPVPPFTEQLRIVESINKVLPSVNTLIKD